MTFVILKFLSVSFLATFVLAFIPTKHIQAAIIATGACAIAWLAPFSLLWMLSLTILLWGVMQVFHARGPRVWPALLVTVLSAALLLALREMSWLTALGAAYFSLRIIHVALEWWMERINRPSLAALLAYNLFLPTFIIGPIHRFPNFDREMSRRRPSGVARALGAERVLIGLFMVVVMGGFLSEQFQARIFLAFGGTPSFALDWSLSAAAWVELYFIFAGLSAIAVGNAKIIGITIEENFDAPYKARSLVEFWSRWHMSLTFWCRDYVYQPLASYARSPVIGVFAAMLVLGLWHESSAYYVLWSLWQATGILLSQLFRPYKKRLPELLERLTAPIVILGWLSLAKPVVNRVLEIAQ